MGISDSDNYQLDNNIFIGEELCSKVSKSKAIVIDIISDGTLYCVDNNGIICTIDEKYKKLWYRSGKHYKVEDINIYKYKGI